MKQKVTVLILVAVSIAGIVMAQPALAEPDTKQSCANQDKGFDAKTETCTLKCTVLPQNICAKAGNTDLESSGVWAILILLLNIMTALVGVVAVGALGFAGFLYATSADDASKVKKAREMILNTCIGLGAYGAMYVGLNFLIPGGIFT